MNTEEMNRLFENIYDFSQADRQMYRYAQRKHNDTGAVRKGSGLKYFVHPEEVAKLVQKYGGDDVEVKAALAHDLVEDAGATIDDIDEKFGKRVAEIVGELTNDTFEIRLMGKEKYMDLKLEKLSHSALFVKLADILHNAMDFPTQTLKNRLWNNIIYLKSHRDLTEREENLVDSINDVLKGDN